MNFRRLMSNMGLRFADRRTERASTRARSVRFVSDKVALPPLIVSGRAAVERLAVNQQSISPSVARYPRASAAASSSP